MTLHQEAYETVVASLARQFSAAVQSSAAKLNITSDALRRAVIGEALGEETLADGRAGNWRVRLRLFDCNKLAPEADTDDQLDADEPGETVIRGLPKMLSWLAELASGYHGAVCVGLEEATLKRKLRSLRVQMAYRKDGTGVLRAPYQVTVNGVTRRMVARADVVRADLVREKRSFFGGSGANSFPSL